MKQPVARWLAFEQVELLVTIRAVFSGANRIESLRFHPLETGGVLATRQTPPATSGCAETSGARMYSIEYTGMRG